MAIAQPLQHGTDRTITLIGQRQQSFLIIPELLMLSADAPILHGLAAVSQILRQLFLVFDRAAAGLRNGHKGRLRCKFV